MRHNCTLSQFDYDKGRRILTAELSTLQVPPGAGFPNVLAIRSERTGKVVQFAKDLDAAQANEFWDGELFEYIALNIEPPLRAVLLND